MEAIKDGATKRINRSRREADPIGQPRFFDRALRKVGEYNEKVQYITSTGKGQAGEPCGRVAVVERARLHRKRNRGDSERIRNQPRVAARR